MTNDGANAEEAAAGLRELRQHVGLADRPSEDFGRLRAMLLGEPFKLHRGETVPTLVNSLLRWVAQVEAVESRGPIPQWFRGAIVDGVPKVDWRMAYELVGE